MSETDPPNKTLVKRFYGAFCARDWPAMRTMMCDDATYWIAGSTAASGTIAGADSYIGFVSGAFGAAVGRIQMRIGQITAEADRVSLEATSAATFPGDFHYSKELHLLIQIRDGKIASVREYMDTARAQAAVDHLQTLGILG